MNTISNGEPKKHWFLRIMTIGGFIGLIIILAWLGVKVVQFMPTAVTSLASIAETVYQYRAPEITIVSNRTESNSGETFELSWPIPRQAGTFGISYECQDGVSLDARVGLEIVTLPCNDIYRLGAVSGVVLRAQSERVRETNIPVTIHFFRAESDTIIAENTRAVTVLNPAIEAPILAEENANDPEPTPAPLPPAPAPAPQPTPAPTPSAPSRPTPLAPAPARPLVQYQFQVPVSNPSGFTDLITTYTAIGSLSGTTFTPRTSFVKTSAGSAVQFNVRNVGTKTSTEWSYLIKLPDGTIVTALNQAPLKPNERAVITHGFATPTTPSGTLTVTITGGGDSSLTNNSVTQTVTVR